MVVRTSDDLFEKYKFKYTAVRLFINEQLLNNYGRRI